MNVATHPQAAPTASLPRVRVDVVIDFCCPFCLIGCTHLDQAVTALAGEVDVELVYHPFELDPHAPEGGVDIVAKLREKHGVDPTQIWPGLEARARDSGIEVRLADQPLAYPTVRGHTLVRLAAAHGLQRQMARAIVDAYFLRAANIHDVDTLVALAEAVGLPGDEARAVLEDREQLAATRAQAQRTAAAGVSSVPTLVVGGKSSMSASQPVAMLVDAFRRAAVAE